MRCDEVGVRVSRQEFVDFLNGVHPGQFFVVKGYANEHGEVADHILRFGIKYGNIKARDAAVLRSILSGGRGGVFGVVHGCHVPTGRIPALFLTPQQVAALHEDSRRELVEATVSYEARVGGSTLRVRQTGTVNLMDVETFTNRKGAGKTPCTLSYRLPASHPLVVAAIGAPDLQGTLLQSIENPARPAVEYGKEARSCYSLEKDGQPAAWYIRDVLRVHKTVRVPGEYPFKASLPINAVKDAIEEQALLRGRYREFKLTDGQFESITIEGQAVLCDGITEEFFFALPGDVKAALAAERAVDLAGA